MDWLEQCLPTWTGEESNNNPKTHQRKHCQVHRNASALARQLATLLGNSWPVPEVQGAAITTKFKFSQPLLSYTLWPPKSKQRKGVNPGTLLVTTTWPFDNPIHPLIMTKFATCVKMWLSVWFFMSSRYTVLAITKSFWGSPHADAHDTTTYQHMVACGLGAGRLWWWPDCALIMVLKKFVSKWKIIWVRLMEEWCIGWKFWQVKDTVSVVFYCSTDKADYTEPADQQIHNEWMQSMKQKGF